MTNVVTQSPRARFLDNNGNPIPLGQVFVYQPVTTTKITSYQDQSNSNPNTNPIQLDFRSECDLWLPPGTSYKLVLAMPGDTDPPTNPIWTRDNLTSDQLGVLTLTAAQVGTALYPQTAAEIAAGVTPTNYVYPTAPYDIRRYGADSTGIADSRAALNSASLVNQPMRIPAGTYLVNSNVTLSPNVIFDPGMTLKPASGVTITLTSSFQAGIYQIFDLTLGGLVQLPQRTSEVWAEWWGAKGDNVKTNNEVPFNQAWFALAGVPNIGFGYGGVIRFARGIFLHSGTIFSSDNISHRGDDFFNSVLLANAGTWNAAHSSSVQSQSATLITFTAAPAPGATSATLSAAWGGSSTTYTVVFFETAGGACPLRTVTLTNGATTATWAGGLTNACTVNAVALGYLALFNNRIENCRVHVNAIAAITQAIYAPAWQQKCGSDNVYIQGCTKYGILMDNGYGGAAQLTLKRTEIFHDPSCVAGSYGIYANFPNYTVGWIDIDLQEIQTGSFSAPVTFTAGLVAATSGTLTGNWAYPSGAWNVVFSDGSYRLVTLTNGATTATWSGAITATANASGVSPNSSGISGNGRVILNAQDSHHEGQASAYVLQGACQLTGEGIKPDGSATVQNVIVCSGGWTGNINVKGMMRGGATTYILDNSRGPYPLANAPGVAGFPGGSGGGNFSNQVIWPPDPSIPFAAARAVGTATPSLNYNIGISAVAHQATGQYRFTLTTPAFGSATYHVMAISDLTTSWTVVSTTQFDIFTRNSAGTLTDCSQLAVMAFHSQ